MSDFLTNLAARSLGNAPTLRPRLAGLFEPRPSGAPLEQPERAIEEIGESGADANPIGSHPPAHRPLSPEPTLGAQSPPDPLAPQSTAPDWRQLAAGAADRASTADSPLDPATPERHAWNPSRAGADTLASERLAIFEPLDSASPRPPALGAEPAGEVRAPAQAVVLGRTEALHDRPRGQDRPTREVTARPAEPHVRGPRPPAAHEPPLATRADAPPTISVTIGRIEVRAVHQPAPARPTVDEPRSPRLSLDDYLKQREGERP